MSFTFITVLENPFSVIQLFPLHFLKAFSCAIPIILFCHQLHLHHLQCLHCLHHCGQMSTKCKFWSLLRERHKVLRKMERELLSVERDNQKFIFIAFPIWKPYFFLKSTQSCFWPGRTAGNHLKVVAYRFLGLPIAMVVIRSLSDQQHVR